VNVGQVPERADRDGVRQRDQRNRDDARREGGIRSIRHTADEGP
jgi:hypothetical protein